MRRALFPLLLGVVGTAILISLGVWQVQRLDQKETMLARIEARIGDQPVDMPQTPDPEADEYLPVQISGEIGTGAVFVLKGVVGQNPAFRLIVPVHTQTRTLMADLGAIPETARAGYGAEGAITITGNLHWPDETSGWTPAPDGGVWYARDVDAMARHLSTDPVLVVARRHDRPDLGAEPIPVSTSNIPNDHLGYAITWFGLAIVWAVMSLWLIRRTLRSAS